MSKIMIDVARLWHDDIFFFFLHFIFRVTLLKHMKKSTDSVIEAAKNFSNMSSTSDISILLSSI